MTNNTVIQVVSIDAKLQNCKLYIYHKCDVYKIRKLGYI